VLLSLALRARAGDPRASLEAIAKDGVEAICGAKRISRIEARPGEPR
jgi:hypothetical protein